MLLLFILNNKSIAQWTADPSLNTEISSASGEQAIPKIVTSTSYPGISYISWFPTKWNYDVMLQN